MSTDSDDRSEHRRRIWKNEAGPFFEEVTRSFESATALLTHPDPRARLVAMLLIKDHWRPVPYLGDIERGHTSDFDPVYKKLAFEDDSPKVRGAAMLHVVMWFSQTHDLDLSRKLAGVLRDVTQPPEIRFVAYAGLLAVNDLESELWRSPRKSCLDWTPEDVDWGLVDRCLGNRQNIGP